MWASAWLFELANVLALPRPHATAKNAGQHQRDRVGVLDCGAGVQERETLAWRRPARALGRVGTLGRTKTVPKGHGTQTDSGAHQRIRSAGALEIGSCQKEKGIVEWVAREPLVSTEIRAFPTRMRLRKWNFERDSARAVHS